MTLIFGRLAIVALSSKPTEDERQRLLQSEQVHVSGALWLRTGGTNQDSSCFLLGKFMQASMLESVDCTVVPGQIHNKVNQLKFCLRMAAFGLFQLAHSFLPAKLSDIVLIQLHALFDVKCDFSAVNYEVHRGEGWTSLVSWAKQARVLKRYAPKLKRSFWNQDVNGRWLPVIERLDGSQLQVSDFALACRWFETELKKKIEIAFLGWEFRTIRNGSLNSKHVVQLYVKKFLIFSFFFCFAFFF